MAEARAAKPLGWAIPLGSSTPMKMQGKEDCKFVKIRNKRSRMHAFTFRTLGANDILQNLILHHHQ